MRRLPGWLLFLCLSQCSTAVAAEHEQQAQRKPVQLAVDATEISRGIIHAHLKIPLAGGPVTLLYPKWIPGEHGPSGPIVDLVGLRMTAAGAPVTWRRDPADMFAFRCDVPPRAGVLDVDLDYLDSGAGKFSSGRSASDHIAALSWNTVLLYPGGTHPDALTYTAQLRLPDGWDSATVLPEASRSRGEVTFRPVSLTRLIDSPVLMGAHVRTIELDPGPPSHAIALAADDPTMLAMSDERRQGLGRLADESLALFGWRPYERYLWLLSLSEHVAHFGLEHHECSDDRIPERALIEDYGRRDMGYLLAHEHAHSWNGKSHRPAGLVRPDYQQSLDTALLWTYEGLTTYLGVVLATRAGLVKAEESRDLLAQVGALLDRQAGRRWRPLSDTTTAAQLLYLAPFEGRALRRGVDFYPEGALIWLEADVVIRRATQGQRSLDDFCRRLFHGPLAPYEVRGFSFEDVVAALDATAHHDWRGFLIARLDGTSDHAPLGGIEGGGWRLAFSETPNTEMEDAERWEHMTSEVHSLGIWLKDGGLLTDVTPGMAAATAGLAPGMKIVAVNGRRYSPEVLRDAIKATTGGATRLELLVENADYFHTHVVDYDGGRRNPHLVRDESQPDLLSAILAPAAQGQRAR